MSQNGETKTHAHAALRRAALMIAFYGIGTAAGITLFVLAFLAGSFRFIPILFYRGLTLLPFVAILHAGVMLAAFKWVHRYVCRFSTAHLVTVVMAAFLVNATFFTLVPVNLDRSISVFLLAWMDQRPERPQTKGDLERAFQDIYVTRFGAMDRRVSEQLASGNLVATPEGYKITTQGRAFVALAKVIGALFSVDSRFIAPPEQLAEGRSLPLAAMTR